MGSVNAAVLNTLLKCTAMGMPLQEVVYRTTDPGAGHPAPPAGHPLRGAEADVAVLRLLPGRQRYIDCGRAYFEGEGRLECAMTLRAGRVVWDPHGTLPFWEEAPERYWTVPSLQR